MSLVTTIGNRSLIALNKPSGSFASSESLTAITVVLLGVCVTISTCRIIYILYYVSILSTYLFQHSCTIKYLIEWIYFVRQHFCCRVMNICNTTRQIPSREEILSFLGNLKVHSMSTRVHHLTLSRAVHIITPHLRQTLISFFPIHIHFSQVVPSILAFQLKLCVYFSFLLCVLHTFATSSSLIGHPKNIW